MAAEVFPRKATLADVLRLIARLNEAGASYFLVGGYALNALGYTRATEDVDILVAHGQENAHRVIDALLALPEEAAREIDPAWFDESDTIRIGGEFVVDILFRAAGQSYDDLSAFVEVVEVDGLPIRTLNLEGLLKTKQTYRDKDKIDRLALERALEELQRQENEGKS